ncbi:MAG TPA: DUF58 domain-containing protein [Pyrinomonadaceae bacterium]|nr:DUF58 domain-containing protein [Pyrinomonadaceae bacterium]
MNLRALSQLFSIRDLRNAVFGVIVVFGGIGLAALTLFAHRSGNPRLAGIAAGVSLVFVLLILIFVVPPLAKNASKEASQLNLPFEFTLGGAIMLGLLVIVGFSAWNTGNNLLFLVLSFLIVAMIVGFVAGGLCLKKLDVKMRFPETIFAGEETSILVSIHNRKRLLPSYSVVAEVRGKERDESIAADDLRKFLPKMIANRLAKAPVVRRTLDYFAHLPRNHITESKVPHIFPTRGRFVIKDFELSTRFPFAFFRHRRRLPARETELVVLPSITPLSSEIDDLPLEAGQLLANKRGSGQDLLSLREYLPNDDLRRVDWKATARSRGLIVREFAAEDDRKITLFFDPRIPENGEKKLSLREKIESEQEGKAAIVSERFEQAISRAASILSHFAEQQAEVRLMIGKDAGEFGVGSRHLIECLKRLAVMQPKIVSEPDAAAVAEPLAELLEKDEISHFFVLTTLKDSDFSPDIVQKTQILSY